MVPKKVEMIFKKIIAEVGRGGGGLRKRERNRERGGLGSRAKDVGEKSKSVERSFI